MAVLTWATSIGALIALAAGGCYAPDLRDCTVTCVAADECAGDQVCNQAGLCAADGVTCSGGGGGATPDGGVDAPSVMITLRVQVMGTGMVTVDGIGECDDSECTWQVPRAALRLTAQMLDSDKPFERWTTANCGGAQERLTTCTFTPTASTTVGAKFR